MLSHDLLATDVQSFESNNWICYLDDQISYREHIRFIKALDKYVVLRDVVCFLSGNFQPGDTIPAERTLEIEVGYCRPAIREALIKLECFGYLEIKPGRAKVLLKVLPEYVKLVQQGIVS